MSRSSRRETCISAAISRWLISGTKAHRHQAQLQVARALQRACDKITVLYTLEARIEGEQDTKGPRLLVSRRGPQGLDRDRLHGSLHHPGLDTLHPDGGLHAPQFPHAGHRRISTTP
jgi:hypothetical protein